MVIDNGTVNFLCVCNIACLFCDICHTDNFEWLHPLPTSCFGNKLQYLIHSTRWRQNCHNRLRRYIFHLSGLMVVSVITVFLQLEENVNFSHPVQLTRLKSRWWCCMLLLIVVVDMFAVKELSVLHDRHLHRPTLDDSIDEERSIEVLTEEVTQVS